VNSIIFTARLVMYSLRYLVHNEQVILAFSDAMGLEIKVNNGMSIPLNVTIPSSSQQPGDSVQSSDSDVSILCQRYTILLSSTDAQR
jgi:hypothetical protein